MKTSHEYVNGLHAEYSNVNNAWFLMWYDSVLHTFQTLEECELEADNLVSSQEGAA